MENTVNLKYTEEYIKPLKEHCDKLSKWISANLNVFNPKRLSVKSIWDNLMPFYKLASFETYFQLDANFTTEDKQFNHLASVAKHGFNLWVPPNRCSVTEMHSKIKVIDELVQSILGQGAPVVINCEHPRQVHGQTEVFIDGGWQPSSLKRVCVDCDYVSIETPATAFLSDTVPRRVCITRDDRSKL